MSPENYTPLPEHERFEQMCALLALGELPEDEFKEIQRHLVECESCQQLYTDFCRIGSDDLGFAAAHRAPDAAVPVAPSIAKEASPYLERLYGRIADADQGTRKPKAAELRRASGRGTVAAFRLPWVAACAMAAAAVVVLVLGYFRYEQASARAKTAEAHARSLQAQLEQQRRQSIPARPELQDPLQEMVAVLTARRDELQRELAEADAKNKDWQIRAEDLRKQLSDASTQADLTAHNLQQALAASRNESDKRNEGEQQLRANLKQLAGLQDQRTEAVLHASEQERQISDLKAQLASQSAALDRTQAAIAGTGQDGKNLFGARNLHIVDVYDVDGSGNTKRTFGRVYYVEKQLLVFYAFDLEAKRRNQMAAGFQAWGYREVGSSKPASLGMFHLDDPALNRWTLSVNDPHVLEHIDALFVTLEPPEGSPTPKGRRLLYASLAGVPNHP